MLAGFYMSISHWKMDRLFVNEWVTVTGREMIILVTKSGETREVKGIVSFEKSFPLLSPINSD